MNKKVLLWDKNFSLKNTGGPSGYMWNIKTYIQECPDNNYEDIKFYSDFDKIKKPLITNFLDRIIMKILTLVGLKHFCTIYYAYFSHGYLSEDEKKIIKQFDFVHFHTLPSVLSYTHRIQKLGVKTIYTSHSPELMIDELAEQHSSLKKIFTKYTWLKEYFIKKELKAYESSNFIMFPTKFAIECYLSKNRLLDDFFNNTTKMFFVPTAIKDDREQDRNKETILKDIPNDAIKLCYVGRHNKVKSYYVCSEKRKRHIENG